MSLARNGVLAAIGLGAAATVAWFALERDAWTPAGKARIASLSLSRLPPLPADPSNRFADLPAAASFGEVLFKDPGMSGDGGTSCASCHDAARQFQDGRAVALGAGTGTRRTMTLVGTAYSPWLFWDGHADSQWAQALGPIENPVEHAIDRVGAVRHVATVHPDTYGALFGPPPDLDGLPAAASPLATGEPLAAWNALPPARRFAIDRAFANIGKALAAYQRTLSWKPTRFDRYADAMASGNITNGILSPVEEDGLRLFIGKAGCATCHDGPRLTDDAFHNTGVPTLPGQPLDRGRADAVAKVVRDPFNCVGAFSDAAPDDCMELRFISSDADAVRAFRTTSLREIAGRAPYMHAGQIKTLPEVVDHYAAAPKAPAGHSELKPLDLSASERAALVAFLRTLSAGD